jgi:hypothetical protein
MERSRIAQKLGFAPASKTSSRTRISWPVRLRVGTFCSELHKAGGSVATRATEIFVQHLAWIESQFRALGKGKDSNGLAVHLLSAMQGVSILAHAFS